MRIAVDAFGGDNAPAAVVEGCIDALKKYPDMSVTLCGDEERIKAELEKNSFHTIAINDDEAVVIDHQSIKKV